MRRLQGTRGRQRDPRTDRAARPHGPPPERGVAAEPHRTEPDAPRVPSFHVLIAQMTPTWEQER